MNSHSEGRGKALLALPTLSLNTHSAEDRKEAGVGGRSQGQGTRQGLEDPGCSQLSISRAMEAPGGPKDRAVTPLPFEEAGGRGWRECV